MAGGHQMVWAQNGAGTAAMGTGVWTSGTLTGANVNTGLGANELYAMNQNVRTTDSPTFAGLTISGEMVGAGVRKLSFTRSVTSGAAGAYVNLGTINANGSLPMYAKVSIAFTILFVS